MQRRALVYLGGPVMQGGQIFGSSGGVIKSIQIINISLAGVGSNTQTVTAVDPANSILIALGVSESNGGSADGFARLALTSNVLVTATRVGTLNTLTVAGMLVEFYPGTIKSIQNISINVANGSATGTQAVTSVDITKAFLIPLGFSVTDNASGNSSNWSCTLVLTSNILVTAARGGTTGANVVNGMLVEYY